MSTYLHDKQLFQAAWLYYINDMKQSDIANILQVSRPSVALYLKQAREKGMIQISMQTEAFSEHQVAQKLEQRFGLDSAFVLTLPDENNASNSLANLAKLGAEVLLKHTQEKDKLGVAWGQTLYEVAKILPRKKISGLEVLQLCGNLGAPFGYAPEQCTIEIASRLSAISRNLYAPLALSTPQAAHSLAQEPVIAEQLTLLNLCNKAIFSFGSCNIDSHIVKCGCITEQEMQQSYQQGARAVIAGRLINADGAPYNTADQSRTLGISLEQLKNIEFRLVIAGGIDKTEAIVAGLKGGFATHLVIDIETANAVLAASD